MGPAAAFLPPAPEQAPESRHGEVDAAARLPRLPQSVVDIGKFAKTLRVKKFEKSRGFLRGTYPVRGVPNPAYPCGHRFRKAEMPLGKRTISHWGRNPMLARFSPKDRSLPQ